MIMARHPARPRTDPPWSVPLRIDEVPETGLTLALAAEPGVRAKVADLAGVPGIGRLEAEFELTKRADGGLHVSGRVRADVEQTCSITLEPMTASVDEAIRLDFVPPKPGTDGDDPSAAPDTDDVEPLIGGVIDLGALATEFLILGIDPYPRKEGAAFSDPGRSGAPSSPFDVLAKLRK
jgi:uncharacterized metal-binding protein YceD (DUF177 family)